MNAPPIRIRRDPRDPASMRARVPVAAASKPVTTVEVVEPACLVMAVVDLDAGRLSASDRDLMGAARLLADALDGAVVMAAFLPDPRALRARPDQEGADRLMLFSAGPDELPEARVATLIAAADAHHVRHLVFADTFAAGELARRVAARLGDRAAFNVRRLSAEDIVADIDAGATEVTRPLPRVIVIAASVFAPPSPVPPREARRLELPAQGPDTPRVRPLGTLPLDPAAVPLPEAELILSAGNGLKDWGAFHTAATALGAAEAGSRVVCDAGLLPRSRQVGVSGLLVEPRCYIALGIAGASQHLQGIAGAERVIAVNADPRCDMIRRADLAIVADVQAILPALVRRAEARTAKSTGAGSAPGKGLPSPVAGDAESSRRREKDEGIDGHRTSASGPTGYLPRGQKGIAFGDVVVLASLGRHPVSKRERRAERDARALELALSLGLPVTAVYAGPTGAAATVLRDHVGAGAAQLDLIACEAGTDPWPALEEYLRKRPAGLIFAGARAEAGECSGMTPFWLAERLGIGLATHIVALQIEGSTVQLVQALPGGRRRRLVATGPLIVTVERSAPEPRLSARMRALRGVPAIVDAGVQAPDARGSWTAKPSRPRPKRLIAPKAAGQSDSEADGRREMIEPDPDEAADAILAFLEREGLLATTTPEPVEATA